MRKALLFRRLGIMLGVLSVVLIPQVTLAALQVQFEATPLFLNADIKPGDVVSRTVTVTNTGPDSETVIFDFQNEFSDGLADVMELAVTTDTNTYADNFFTNLFALGQMNLGTLNSGDSAEYTFTAFLDPTIGNEYQLSEFGFDLILGFQGGAMVTDSGGSGGGGGGGSTLFTLFNEDVTTPTNSSAELTWNTNRPASSYAVCGDTSDGPFALDANDALFGYVFASTEDTSTSLQHKVTFEGLALGNYECRVASREKTSDKFTVSGPLDFAFLPAGQVEGISIDAPVPTRPLVSSNLFTPAGIVAGASSGGKGTFGGPTYAEWRAELDARRANEIAAEEALASSTQANKDAAALRERPRVQSSSSETKSNSADGFLADNWWWMVLLAMAGSVSIRSLIWLNRS